MARTSIIGPTSIVIGDVSGRGDLEIAGRVQGDVNVQGLVHVHEDGSVLGSIRAQDVRVAGHVEGTVTAKATLLLQAGANVHGDLVATRLGIEEGARVHGSVRTEEPQAKSDEGRSSAEAAPAPASGAAAPQERRQRDRRRHQEPTPLSGPTPASSMPIGSSPTPSSRSQTAPPAEVERTSAHRPGRNGPPMPVVPALAKGARGKRRLSRS